MIKTSQPLNRIRLYMDIQSPTSSTPGQGGGSRVRGKGGVNVNKKNG